MIRSSTPQDVLELAHTMRKDDIEEIEALMGLGPAEALAVGLFHSEHCMTGIGRDGKVVGMFGVVPTGPREGSVWFLSSDAIKENVRETITTARAWLNSQDYDVLTNTVTSKNRVHIRLIRALGFSLGKAEGGIINFERRRPCADQQ